MLGMLAKLLKALSSEASPWSLAWGIALGMMLGFTPLLSLHNIVLVLIAFTFRVNLSFFFLSFAVCSGLAYALDPLFDFVGEWLLTASSLQGLWFALYELPLARLAQFNHTITLGSVAVSLLFIVPVLFIARFVIVNYRSRIQKRIEKLPLVQLIKGTKFWATYQKVSGLCGGFSS